MLRCNPKSVLEIGAGNHIVANILRQFGIHVTTLDINESLKPDIVGPANKIPLERESFDAVLAGHILEHLPFDQFNECLKEIYRVSKKDAVISIPHYGLTFSIAFKFPLLKWKRFIFKIPYFWKTKPLSGEHYWEIGLRGYSLARVENAIKNSGFFIFKRFISYDDPYRMIFVLKKRNVSLD